MAIQRLRTVPIEEEEFEPLKPLPSPTKPLPPSMKDLPEEAQQYFQLLEQSHLVSDPTYGGAASRPRLLSSSNTSRR